MVKTRPLDGLKPIPMFQGLTKGESGRLESLLEEVTFEPGELLIEQGHRSQNLWVLVEGKCEVFKHDAKHGDEPVMLATLEPFATLGEMSFFQSAPHSASVRAQQKVKLLRFSRAKFDDLVGEDPSLACKLSINAVRTLADRMRRMDEWVAELMGQKGRNKTVSDWAKLHEQLFNTWQL